MTPNETAVLAACRAHAPQFDRMDPTIQKYALAQMQDAISAYLASIGGIVCAREPAAWAHRLNLELDQFITEFTAEAEHPFGKPGEDYSPEYTVTSTPLHIPIEAGNGGDGWLDIASAPTRSHILLALPNGVVVEGYWGAARYNRKTKDYDYAWVTHPSSGDIKPTNWRPLPAPPSTPSHEGREKA